MTSLQHGSRRLPRAIPAAVQPSAAAVGQARGSTGRPTGPNARRRPGGMHIATQRHGPVTTVRVSGGRTEIGTRHLAALLDAMASAGCEQVIVHLADVDMVDSGAAAVLADRDSRAVGGRA